jgi:ATP-dependent DNA ligase
LVADRIAFIRRNQGMARSARLTTAAATAELPAWIKPQLCQLVREAPSGDGWAHELKFDGYRMHARLDQGDVRLLTRTGLNWTGKYPAIATALGMIPARRAYLDGELCGVRPDGVTSFALIQNAAERRGGADLVYFVFDLLHLDGRVAPRRKRATKAGRSGIAEDRRRAPIAYLIRFATTVRTADLPE